MRNLLISVLLCCSLSAFAGSYSSHTYSSPTRTTTYKSPSYSPRPSVSPSKPYTSPTYSRPSTPTPKPSPMPTYSSPTYKSKPPITSGPVLPNSASSSSAPYNSPTVVHHYNSGPGFWFWMWALDRPNQQPIVVSTVPSQAVATQPTEQWRSGNDGPAWYVIAANIAIIALVLGLFGWLLYWGWNRYKYN